MSKAQARKEREKAGLAFLLAWVAGSVDAIGFLVLFHLFTAHMSGNSAALGAYLGHGDYPNAFHRFFPIPVFVIGVMLGASLVEIALRRHLRAPFSVVFGLEFVLLLAFLLFGSTLFDRGAIRTDSQPAFYALAALPALAMGLQNATLRRVYGLSIRTTYITGMLTSFSEEAVSYLFWLHDRTRRRSWRRRRDALRLSPRNLAFVRLVLHGGIFFLYIVGAVCGGLLVHFIRMGALVLPLAGLGVIIGADLARPVYTATRTITQPEAT